MRTSWLWSLCLIGACAEVDPVPEPSFRNGGEEGMNCMGASHVTVVAGPGGGPMFLTTREAVARFGDEIELTGWHTESGGVAFVGSARSFDAIIHGTWFEKLYQVALPDEDWCGGVGPTGDLIGGHYDKAGLAGSCPEDGAAVGLDPVRNLIKAYLYALVQDSACPLPPGSDDAEGHFAAVEVIMLAPGATYELQALIDQNIVRAVPEGQAPQYLCLIWGAPRVPPAPAPYPTPVTTVDPMTGTTVTIADALPTLAVTAVRATEPQCRYELGVLEAVVEVDGLGLPISYAGPDDLGPVGAVRDFLRSPEESQGTVTAIRAVLGCTWLGVICVPTVTIHGFDVAIGPSLSHHIWDPSRSIAVVLPIDAEVTCSGECPPVMAALSAAECEEPPGDDPPPGEGTPPVDEPPPAPVGPQP